MNKELGQLLTFVINKKVEKQFSGDLGNMAYWQGYIDAMQQVRVKIHELNEGIVNEANPNCPTCRGLGSDIGDDGLFHPCKDCN